MHPRVRRAHDIIRHRFRRRGSDLVYNYAEGACPEPTPEEIAAGVPNPGGWGTSIEDCCLNMGWLLDGLLTAHRITGGEEWADKARSLFDGLCSLGEAPPLRGFVARGYLPGRTEVYPNTSADQVTAFVCGLRAFAASSLAVEEDRARAARLVVDVASLIDRFGQCMPTLDMQPSIWGSIARLAPDRGQRLLLIYRAAHVLSGDAHWGRSCRNALHEFGGARLFTSHGPTPVPLDVALYAPFQSQMAWCALHDMADDNELRLYHRTAMRLTAQAVIAHIDRWRNWTDAPPSPMPDWREEWQRYVDATGAPPPRTLLEVSGSWEWMREQAPRRDTTEPNTTPESHLRAAVDAVCICMLCPDEDVRALAAERAQPMLDQLDVENLYVVTPLAGLEGAYWRGVEAGLFSNEWTCDEERLATYEANVDSHDSSCRAAVPCGAPAGGGEATGG